MSRKKNKHAKAAVSNAAQPPPQRPPARVCPQCTTNLVKQRSPQGTICKPCSDINHNNREVQHEQSRLAKMAAKAAAQDVSKQSAPPRAEYEVGSKVPCEHCANQQQLIEVGEDGKALCDRCLAPFRFQCLPPELQDHVFEHCINDCIETKIFTLEPSKAPSANPGEQEGVKKTSTRVYMKHVEEGHYYKDRRFTLGMPFERVDRASHKRISNLLAIHVSINDPKKTSPRIPIIAQVVNGNFNSAANALDGFSPSEKTAIRQRKMKFQVSIVCTDHMATVDVASLNRFLGAVDVPFEIIFECPPGKGMYPLHDLQLWNFNRGSDPPFDVNTANTINKLYSEWEMRCVRLSRYEWRNERGKAASVQPLKEPGHIWCACRPFEKCPQGLMVCEIGYGHDRNRHICHSMAVNPHDTIPECEHFEDIESDEEEDYKPTGKGWQKEFGMPAERYLQRVEDGSEAGV
ncbi:hypothetical protein HII31_01174 [Pseudocercospora fuligena]|uniref:Uncharacterized protein n=1 Tax=Pseudocercospora fuligena TaxID=685502 RepID=A0A8H6RTU1_9PEZI|nr:hypothetical protein HII31_01174 [Pseudocercospora fuligena]